MKLDYSEAKQILEEEAANTHTLEMKGEWVDRIQALSESCRINSKTMIAALGTAILAKATNPSVDCLSLKVGEDRDGNTYSARALCKDVLAANATRLGIDLGVSGREPLNNQPFFGKDRISRSMNAKSNAQESLELLVDILESLNAVTSQTQARLILRSFLQVRRRKRRIVDVGDGTSFSFSQTDLLEHIYSFVAENGEGGKRAQAVAAGLFDLVYGPARVIANRINDPSRDMPGDIGILRNPESDELIRTIEVRDKPVTTKDIAILIDAAQRHGVSKLAMLAVSDNQQSIDEEESIRWGMARNIWFRLFLGWDDLLTEALYWMPVPGVPLRQAFDMIFERIKYYEVTEEGIELWRNI